MNFIEALKSGKKFRPKGTSVWMEDPYGFLQISKEMFLGEWEIEEESITVTRSQVADAWDQCIAYKYKDKNLDAVPLRAEISAHFDRFISLLGFCDHSDPMKCTTECRK